jgi:hypothetical protein
MVLFRNMKQSEIPWEKEDPGYSAFWENEKDKVKNGVEIDGFKFSGWLYWHLNHWKIMVDDDKGADTNVNSDIIIITPDLRDNEYILNEALLRAEEERKGLVIMGLRQMGKTSFESSIGGRAGIIFKNSQNLIMGTNAEDLNNITQSIDFGLLNCTPFFRIPRINRDWDAERVLLGVKNKQGDNFVHSTYVIRNTAGGNKTEKGAGVSNLKSNLWDEIGKENFLSALVATKQAMLGQNGWRCIPICTGTGGNVVKAQDAKKLFYDPEAHNFLPYTQDDGTVTGLFMGGWLRQDSKYKIPFAQYLLETKRLESIPEDSELWNLEIAVSDKEKAIGKIKAELDALLKAGDTVEYNRWKAYYPLEVDDVFLTESNNAFPIDAIKQHMKELQDYEPSRVDLYRDKDNKVTWKFSDKHPIDKYPVTAKEHKDAPVMVYEHPQANVPHATYIIGIDPYNEETSSDRVNSLGSVYVYKRMYNPMGEFQNSIVASWSGRKKSVKEFHELCLMIAEYYNAIEGVIPENEDKTLIQYFFFKNKGHFLADSFELAKQINPTTRTNRMKGLSAATPNQKHYMNLMVIEAKEEVYTVDEEGNERTKMGVAKIPDIMLLEEMLQYKGKPTGSKGVHAINCDRIVAYGHCLTLAKYYDVKYPGGRWRSPEEEEAFGKREKPMKIKTPWGSFSHQKNNLFIKPSKKNKPINNMFL